MVCGDWFSVHSSSRVAASSVDIDEEGHFGWLSTSSSSRLNLGNVHEAKIFGRFSQRLLLRKILQLVWE
jgi:hypothetical protein